MLQIHTFDLPDDILNGKANDFLAKNKPSGDIQFQGDQMMIFIEDGNVPVEYNIASLNERLISVRESRFQQEVALEVAKIDVKRFKQNSVEYDNGQKVILDLQDGIENQTIKEQFLLKRIEELRSQPNEEARQ